MNLSTQGMLDILSHEGICLEPYLDSVGVWTIGIGQTKSDDLDPRNMGKLTIQQAIDLFKRKIKQYTNAVDALHLELTQYQYDALSGMCYNFGPGNLQKLCHGRSIAQIGEAIMLYTKPPEITERRRKEQKLFKFGIYSNPGGKVLVFPVVNNHPHYKGGYEIDARPYFGVQPVKPASKATAPVAGGVVSGAVVATAAASQGFSWAEIGLTAFIVAGVVALGVIWWGKRK